jgi:hypothetical protein
MVRARRFRRLAWTGAGLAVGLAIGIAIAVGVAIGMRSGDNLADRFPIEELKLKAFAGHGNETFAIATGPVDGTVDGVFCLDYLTGDLTGYVIHPRSGRFGAAFKTNITKDLPIEQGKKPAYALTLGRLNQVASYSNIKPGGSIIYVADCNTGNVAAYCFPWNDTFSKNPQQTLLAIPMITLDKAKARDLKIRE